MMHAGFPGQRGDTRTTVDCKYYLEGRCALGDNCPFRHRPDKFNTAARVGFQPHSLPQICHFYLTGQCNKGDKCAFQHPVLGRVPAVGQAPVQPQDEMNIDFDDDESPKQPQQRSNRTATPHNAPMPAQQHQARQQLQQAPAQPSRVQPAGQQPLQNRLGAPAAAQKRLNGLSDPQQQPRQTTSAEQDDTDQAKSSVFERLGRASVKPASALNRLSAPAQATINSRQASGAATQAANSTINRLSGSAQAAASSRQSSGAAATLSRPMDARDFLVASISNKARVGRKEAEGVTSGLAARRSVLQGARQSSEDLEPVSVSTRRGTVASRGAKAAGTTGLHAPKFATEDTRVSRKSALDRIARPQLNGSSPASSSMNTPAMAVKPRRATIEPYSTGRSGVSPAQPSSSAQPSAAAATEASAHRQPATSTAAAPQSEQPAAAASDKRGRQRIQWQPPTQAQREEAARESRLNVSKRKASESGVTTAESTATPADDASPPKRMKTSTDVAAEQVTEQPDVRQTVQPPTSSAVRPADEAQIDAANSEVQPDESEIDFARGSMDQVDDQDATVDDEFIDDFDDEAAMRELDALT